jgi:hypothetical protein
MRLQLSFDLNNSAECSLAVMGAVEEGRAKPWLAATGCYSSVLYSCATTGLSIG